MNTNETGQLISSAAEVYDQYFVPALFAEWAPRVVRVAKIKAGDDVLDVACGTGVLAHAAYLAAVPGGSVTGVDINEGMLAVARRKRPEIIWKFGRAESLPFEDESFDSVISQFGLMFFEDRPAAVKEMMRLLRHGGTMAVAVWDSLQHTPGYAALAGLLERLFGKQVAAALYPPFILGDTERLQTIFTEAGFPGVQIETITGTARFPSIQSWMFTDIKGWTLADQLNDEQFGLLVKEAESVLSEFVMPDGSVAFNSPAHIASLQKI